MFEACLHLGISQNVPWPPPFPRKQGTHGRQTMLGSVPSNKPKRNQPVHPETRRVSTHMARTLLLHHDHFAENHHFSEDVTRSASSITTVYGINSIGSAAANGRGCVLSEKKEWDLCDQKV